ncbi:MAG: HlyD family secretion protein [Desulfuromonadales bacterium]
MADETTPAQTETADSTKLSVAAKPGSYRKHKAAVMLLIIVAGGSWAGLSMFIKSKTHVETDNAFIEARIVPVSSRVSGTVARVMVNDNQLVKKGDLLLEIDRRDHQVQVSKAAAGVGMAENESGGEQLKVEAARASLQSARARNDQALLDHVRGEKLFSREVISREQLDRMITGKRVAESQLKEAEEILKRAQTEAGLANRGGNKARVLQRRALLEEAQLQLSYTRIFSVKDGYITRKSVEPGANIQAGQLLMALVPLQDAWITANYKERQITHIKAGQKVEFSVDAFPGRTFNGRVDSIMAGTGAAFSLLPPENATGNYVKVVQRLPVKIAINNASDPEHLLRVGMSVIPTVLTGRTAKDVLNDLNPFK